MEKLKSRPKLTSLPHCTWTLPKYSIMHAYMHKVLVTDSVPLVMPCRAPPQTVCMHALRCQTEQEQEQDDEKTGRRAFPLLLPSVTSNGERQRPVNRDLHSLFVTLRYPILFYPHGSHTNVSSTERQDEATSQNKPSRKKQSTASNLS